jgi:hypothetical protein
VWLIREIPAAFGNRFAAVAFGDDLRRFGPAPTEDFLTFAERVLDFCAEHHGDGAILSWQWPGRSYATVTLSCREGTRTIGIEPRPRGLN